MRGGRAPRRPIVAQRRGPGLIGTIAQTAVVAGTATAASRAVSGKMDDAEQRAAEAQQAQASAFESQAEIEKLKAQLAATQMQAAAPVAATAPAGNDLIAQLQQLAQLKQDGVLSEAEFQAAKAKLLGS